MRTRILALAVGMALAQSVSATPISLIATLTGDPRPENPDSLIVNVSVTGDTTSNTANWIIDLNSPAHPDVKLDVFAFNMVGGDDDYSFSNFNLAGWNISAGTNVQGSGGADFVFAADGPGGNKNQVTNNVSLTFTMTKVSGNFTAGDFLNAPVDFLANNSAWAGQMGAHLQSLTVANCTSCTSDSGFAIGSWNGRVPPNEVPEPASLVLLGLGLTGLAARKRKQ